LIARVVVLVVAVISGFVAGRMTASASRQDVDVDLNEIGRTMLAHQSACIEEYHDGITIADQIQDGALKAKFQRQARYKTHLDVTYSKDVRVENCMYEREIYNRFGLNLK
jgi:hypothetical protein